MDDELMRFFERCRGYVEGVEKNRSALMEVDAFKRGEEMEGVRRRMAERLDLPQHRLTPGQTLHLSRTRTQGLWFHENPARTRV